MQRHSVSQGAMLVDRYTWQLATPITPSVFLWKRDDDGWSPAYPVYPRGDEGLVVVQWSAHMEDHEVVSDSSLNEVFRLVSSPIDVGPIDEIHSWIDRITCVEAMLDRPDVRYPGRVRIQIPKNLLALDDAFAMWREAQDRSRAEMLLRSRQTEEAENRIDAVLDIWLERYGVDVSEFQRLGMIRSYMDVGRVEVPLVLLERILDDSGS